DLKDVLHSFALSGDGKLLATGGSKEGRLWDLSGAEPKERMMLPRAYDLVFSPDGKTLAVSDGPGVRFLDVTGEKLRERARLACLGPVAFSPDGKTFAGRTGFQQDHVCLFDLTQPEPIKKASFRCSLTNALAFTPDSKALVTGCGNQAGDNTGR